MVAYEASSCQNARGWSAAERGDELLDLDLVVSGPPSGSSGNRRRPGRRSDRRRPASRAGFGGLPGVRAAVQQPPRAPGPGRSRSPPRRRLASRGAGQAGPRRPGPGRPRLAGPGRRARSALRPATRSHTVRRRSPSRAPVERRGRRDTAPTPGTRGSPSPSSSAAIMAVPTPRPRSSGATLTPATPAIGIDRPCHHCCMGR